MTALFLVRAEVADPRDREAFDRWYQEEHLPQAADVLSAVRAWRGWSDVDPSIHYAFYELPDLKPVPVILNALKALIADFDRVWGTRVTRTREIIDTYIEAEIKEASDSEMWIRASTLPWVYRSFGTHGRSASANRPR